MFKARIITISDKGAKGERVDKSGPILRDILDKSGIKVDLIKVVPDEKDQIKSILTEACDKDHLDLVLTTGGTGMSHRDVTPEATKEIIQKDAPGFSETIRFLGLKSTPHAMISRGVSGIRGETLIINLPGSIRGAREGLESVLPALPHALAKLKGDPTECGKD